MKSAGERDKRGNKDSCRRHTCQHFSHMKIILVVRETLDLTITRREPHGQSQKGTLTLTLDAILSNVDLSMFCGISGGSRAEPLGSYVLSGLSTHRHIPVFG